ncbi:MAG: GNAT family N-acetyltransferase [Candidatus Tectomicrobia bacterium]|nr:GNAT family N-acetyltransferase [Candidatus Tectomicrobia bacterium]
MPSDFLPILFECLIPEELANDRSWWEIYDEAFPPNEREPRQVILNSLQNGVGVAVRARHAGRTIGLATMHLLRNPAAVFLVYIALDRHLRGRGSGGLLLEHAWKVGASYLSKQGLIAIGLIWEVEIPALAATEEETLRRERRIAFFRRHGGDILPRPYFQPPVDGIAPVPMHLMYRPAEEGKWPDPEMTEVLVRAIYFEKYRAVNGIPLETLERLLKNS